MDRQQNMKLMRVVITTYSLLKAYSRIDIFGDWAGDELAKAFLPEEWMAVQIAIPFLKDIMDPDTFFNGNLIVTSPAGYLAIQKLASFIPVHPLETVPVLLDYLDKYHRPGVITEEMKDESRKTLKELIFG